MAATQVGAPRPPQTHGHRGAHGALIPSHVWSCVWSRCCVCRWVGSLLLSRSPSSLVCACWSGASALRLCEASTPALCSRGDADKLPVAGWPWTSRLHWAAPVWGGGGGRSPLPRASLCSTACPCPRLWGTTGWLLLSSGGNWGLRPGCHFKQSRGALQAEGGTWPWDSLGSSVTGSRSAGRGSRRDFIQGLRGGRGGRQDGGADMTQTKTGGGWPPGEGCASGRARAAHRHPRVWAPKGEWGGVQTKALARVRSVQLARARGRE